MPPESSPETELPAEVTAPAETPAKDEKPSSAESSPAVEGEKKRDMLSAVKAALQSAKETSPTSAEATGPKTEKDPDATVEDGAEGDDSEDFSEEELTRLKAKTRKRIENLLTSNTGLRDELAKIKPAAEQFEKVVSFVQEANLNTDEVNQLFQVGKLLKNDPRQAYALIAPIHARLQEMFGDSLPANLQQEVRSGRMTAAHAKQLVATQTEAALARQQLEQRTQRDTQQRQQAATQQFVSTVQTTVTEWENSKGKADPDWKLKQPRIIEKIELAIRREGYPKTPQAAIELAERELKAVNKEFSSLRPVKREVKPTTDVSASSSAVAKPQTALEAARQGLALARK